MKINRKSRIDEKPLYKIKLTRDREAEVHPDKYDKAEEIDHDKDFILDGDEIKTYLQKEYILNSPANPQLAFKQRVVTIADQVDSLISPRAYKRSWSPSAAETYLGNVFENPEIISVAIQSRMRMAA